MSNDERERVWTEIERIETCMMVTGSGDDLRARPMIGRADRGNRAIWFVANNEVKDALPRPDEPLCLAYADLVRNTFVSVIGRATVEADMSRVATMLPRPSEDDEATADALARSTLLRVTPVVGEFWDDPENDVLGALQALTGARDAERSRSPSHRQVRL